MTKEKKLTIRELSDSHFELIPPDYHDDVLQFILPPMRTDKKSVLVLAGDIWSYARPASYENFINGVKDRFRAIININGNHEWYRSIYVSGAEKFRAFIKDIPNFHFLEGAAVVIDDVVFIGAPLWTNFDSDNPLAKNIASRFMNDYNLIAYDHTRMLTPDDTHEFYKIDLHSIEYLLNLEEYKNLKKFVITHHGCSMQSIHPKYKNEGLSNFAFTSNLDDFILKYQPDYWVHGHTHEHLEYNISKTKVLTNPCGYKYGYGMNFENVKYNPKLKIIL